MYSRWLPILLIGIPNIVLCLNESNEQDSTNSKTIFHTNLLSQFNRPKPTEAQVEFEAGVPPGWPPRTSTPRPQNYKPQRGPEVVELFNETATESAPVKLPNVTHEEYLLLNNTNKGGVVDWILGVIGVRPPEDNHIPSPSPIQPPKNCGNCKCGITYKNNRIVGGVETQVNEYPWVTALMYNNRFYCGASLINNKYVLTAAHCVNGFNKDRLTAVFLDHDRSNQFETRTMSRKIANVVRHQLYASGGNYNNDIALLRLDQEVPVTGLLKPVCLPERGKSFTGFTGIAVGWGATQEHGQVSNKLREVEVPILANNACRKTGYGNRITDNMLCAGYLTGKKDSCQGDSGGPLHVSRNSIHEVAGIVSWGEGCAEPNYPGVYTRVNRYISWIESNTDDACYCT